MSFMVLNLFIGICLASFLDPSKVDELLRSFYYPGYTFRQAPGLSNSIPHYQQQQSGNGTTSRVYSVSSNSRLLAVPQRSAPTQRDRGQHGFSNTSAVDRRANQYWVDVALNGSPMKLLIDSGSSDTWARGRNFTCSSASNTTGESSCGLGPAYPGLDFPDGHIAGQHFYISPSDNETVAGLLGYMDIEIAGVTVHRQEIGLASVGSWNGDSVTSGVLGLAYPSLTSAYVGDNVTLHDPEDSTTYSPLFTSMMTSNDIAPYWCLALDRNSSSGVISFGELPPPIDVSNSTFAETHLIITDIAHRGGEAGYQPSYYTIIPTGFIVDTTNDYSRYPFIIDSSTTMTYVPPSIAEAVNSRFDPPAMYLWYYGAYFVKCDAVPPRFAFLIEAMPFWINPRDLINREMVDPLTGLCATTINNGNDGPFVLGLSFLTNALVVFDVGPGLLSFYSREFY